MIHSVQRGLLICFLLTAGCHIATSQVLEDYDQDWKEGARETWISSNDRLLLELDLSTFPLSYLSFQFPNHSVIFVGEKLWFFTDRDTTFIKQVSDFRTEFDKDLIELTVFKEGVQKGDAKVEKVVKPRLLSESESLSQIAMLRTLDRQLIRDFYIVAVLFTMFLIAVYKLAYPFIFALMVKPVSLLNAEDFSESGSLQKFFSLDVLLYVFIINMLLALALLTGLLFFKQEWLSLQFDITFGKLILGWLVASFVLLLLAILKFTALKLLAFLFELKKLEFPHFFYLLRLILVAVGGLLTVGAFYIFNEFSLASHVFELSFRAFFWVYILGIAALFIIMVNRLGFKKYHLFTYLCIAELVPLLILAKWALVLGY